MIISQFDPIIGGAEKQAELLANALHKMGIQINIVTGWWNFGTPHKEIRDGIGIVRNFSCWGMFGIKRLRTLGVFFYAISLGVYLLMHRKEYDILHVHQVLYPAFITALIGKGILGKPVIAKMACSGLTSDIRNMRRFPLGSLQLKYLVKKLDSLVVVNREGVEEFQALGYPPSRIEHIPNGVTFSPDGTNRRHVTFAVITTVRLDRQKGIDILLKAWSDIVSREPKMKLFILGKGPFEAEFKQLSKSLGIVNSVVFTGEVKDVGEYLRKSDIFVLASRAEGMSNALLEAMSQGLACIATKISGNVELFGVEESSHISAGEFAVTPNGILVNPEDVDALSKAALFLVRNPELRETLGKSARKSIKEHYCIDLIADKYIHLYHHVLRGGKECAESVAS